MKIEKGKKYLNRAGNVCVASIHLPVSKKYIMNCGVNRYSVDWDGSFIDLTTPHNLDIVAEFETWNLEVKP